MVEGLLWYDGDKRRPLNEKVKAAAERYRRKFGRAPNVCYLHPSALGNGNERPMERVGRVRLVPKANILPYHFLVGQEEHLGET